MAKTGLSRPLIVRTALAIVDREGLAALSMRRLGTELDVDPMAVYYHIHNKAALLDALVEAVMGEIDLTRDDPSLSADQRLERAFSIYRETLLAHPHALSVMLARPINTPEALKPVEFAIGVFREAGFSGVEALAGVNIIAAFVRGSATMAAQQLTESDLPENAEQRPDNLMQQLPEEQFPNLWACMRDGCVQGCQPEFEVGLRALIRGLMETQKENARQTDNGE